MFVHIASKSYLDGIVIDTNGVVIPPGTNSDCAIAERLSLKKKDAEDKDAMRKETEKRDDDIMNLGTIFDDTESEAEEAREEPSELDKRCTRRRTQKVNKPQAQPVNKNAKPDPIL